MNLKQLFATIALLIVLSLNSLKAQTVYITDSGKKYHAKNCSIVKTGKKGMELAEAKKQGYEPCKSCKADDIKPSPANKPKEKSKK